MKHTKTNPVAKDIELQRIQNKIYPKLLEAWGLSDESYNCYGRAYRNQDSQGLYNPEPFTGYQGKEYADALYNDKVACTSFFGVASESRHLSGSLYETDAFIIFELDLKKCKPEIGHRGDEEVHQDAIQILSRALTRDTIGDVITEIDNIYREYSGWRSNKGIFNTDNHPRHCFRINFTLQFIYDKCYKEPKPVVLRGFDYLLDFRLQ